MTKQAVKQKFDSLVNEVIDGAYDALRPWGIVGPRSLPGNRLAKLVLAPILRNELVHYRVSYNQQYQLMLDYAQDIANGDADYDDYRDEILDFDYFYQNHRGDPEATHALELALADRYTTMARDMAPLVASDEDEFWDAMRECYDATGARRTIRHNFDYANILKEHADHIALYAEDPWIGLPFPVSYTGEVLVALDESESSLRSRMVGEIQRAY